jgi:hypothetical protein
VKLSSQAGLLSPAAPVKTPIPFQGGGGFQRFWNAQQVAMTFLALGVFERGIDSLAILGAIISLKCLMIFLIP